MTAASGEDRVALNTGRCLLAVCIGLHVAGMFPHYILPGPGQLSIASDPALQAEYICLTSGWALSLVLSLSSRSASGGVVLGLALALAETGYLVSDTANSFMRSSGASPGHWLVLAGLLAGAGGCLALASGLPAGWSRASMRHLDGPTTWVIGLIGTVLAVGATAAYFPSWVTGLPAVESGSTFSLPAPVQAGALEAGFAIGWVVLLASVWRPGMLAACGVVGAGLALASQLLPIYVQVSNGSLAQYAAPGQQVGYSSYWVFDAGACVALFALAGALCLLTVLIPAGDLAVAAATPEPAGTGLASPDDGPLFPTDQDSPQISAAPEGRGWPHEAHWPRRPHPESENP